jgi:glycosyltransferase involved in cell wall biosynthesis
MNNKSAKTPLSVLFLTYSAGGDGPGQTAFLGVLKRCLRLIDGMPDGLISPHLLNFGQIPTADPLVKKVLSRTQIHHITSDGIHPMLELFRKIRPDVVVLGEGPGNGKMLELSNAALQVGIPQICIENYYGPGQPQHYKKENPWLDRWLLLGLPLEATYGRIAPYAELVPPLLPVVNGSDTTDVVDMTILGYDPTVARLGIELLHKLPPHTRARLIYSDAIKKYLVELRENTRDLALEFVEPPSEQQFRRYLATSRAVVCKSGFQQMVECLAAGTPAIAYDAPGGVPEILLAGQMRPYVQYFPRRDASWQNLLLKTALWLRRKPVMPWYDTIARFQEPVPYASNRLYELLREVA